MDLVVPANAEIVIEGHQHGIDGARSPVREFTGSWIRSVDPFMEITSSRIERTLSLSPCWQFRRPSQQDTGTGARVTCSRI